MKPPKKFGVWGNTEKENIPLKEKQKQKRIWQDLVDDILDDI